MKKFVSTFILFLTLNIGFFTSAQTTMPDFVIRAAQEINAIYGEGTLELTDIAWDWRWGNIGDNFPLHAGCSLPLNLPPSTNAKQYYRVFFDTNLDGIDEWAVVVYSDYSYFGLCTAPAYSCGLLEPRLAIDAVGHVDASREPNDLRALPGKNSPIIGKIPSTAEFSVIDGPRCSDHVNYWLVNYGGDQGWTAEGEDETYFLIPGVFAEGGVELNPIIPTATPIPTSIPLISCGKIVSRLSVGIMVQSKSGVPNNLRSTPGAGGEYLAEMPAGQSFQIISGPQCISDILWWQVNFQSAIGWVAEASSSGDYWLEPLAFDIDTISVANVNQLVSFATLPQTTSTKTGNPLATYINDRNQISVIWSNREVDWSPLDITLPIPSMQWKITRDRQLTNPPIATRLDRGGEVVKLTRNPANNQLVNWERGTFFDEFDLSLPNTTLDIAAFHPADGDMIMLSQHGKGFVLVNSDPESQKYRQVAQAARILSADETYTQMEFSDNGMVMVGLTDASNLAIWYGTSEDPETWSAAFPIQPGDGITINDVALSPDGQTLAVIGSQSGQGFYTIYELEATGAIKTKTINFGSTALTAVEFTPDGTMTVVATSASQLVFLNANTARELHRVGGFTGLATNITFNSDSTLMATTSSSGIVTLWRIN